MKLRVRGLIAAFLALCTINAWGGISSSEYAGRRARLAAIADTDAAIVFRAADFRVRSGDVSYRYRQESNLLYLTGIAEPNVTLIVDPRTVTVDGQAWTMLLFAPAARAREIKANGSFPDGTVLDASRFEDIFPLVAGSVRSLYLSPLDPGFVNDWLNNRAIFLDQEARQRLREKYPLLKI